VVELEEPAVVSLDEFVIAGRAHRGPPGDGLMFEHDEAGYQPTARTEGHGCYVPVADETAESDDYRAPGSRRSTRNRGLCDPRGATPRQC